jgi:hypothetical protein
MIKYIAVVLLILFEGCEQTNNSPCILQATYDAGASSSSFAFRKDGTFEWTSGSGLGVFQSSGKYILKDSVIMLDKIGFDKMIKSKRLLIASGRAGSYVVQVDDNNRVLDSMFIFTVYIDKRDSL